VSIYYKFYYKILKQYATKSHNKGRFGQKPKNRKVLVALGKSWFFREDRSNEKDTVRLPWQYLPQSYGRVCDERPGGKGWPQRGI
jgi:hypothetical protein